MKRTIWTRLIAYIVAGMLLCPVNTVMAEDTCTVKVIKTIYEQMIGSDGYDTSITQTFNYNSNGLVEKETYSQKNYNTFTYTYSYDERGQLTSEIDKAYSNVEYLYTYDDEGRVLTKTEKGSSSGENATWVNGLCTGYGSKYTYEYDKKLLVTQYEKGTWSAGPGQDFIQGPKKSDYTYDKSGNIIRTDNSFPNSPGNGSKVYSDLTYQNGVVVRAKLNGGKDYQITYETIKIASKYKNLVSAQQKIILHSVNQNAPWIMRELSFACAGNLLPKESKTDPSDSGTNTPTETKKAAKITASNKTYKVSTKTKKYAVILKDSSNKPIENIKLTLKVNGKTYTAKTNSKGKATFNISKLTKKGTFKAVIKFAGDKKYKATSKSVKITVKK